MKNSTITIALISATAIIGLFLFSSITGNVALNVEDVEYLSGEFSIKIDYGDKIPADSPIFISISKDNEVLSAESFSFKEFIDNSDNPIIPLRIDSREYYTQPGTYKARIENFIDYDLNETGDYEMFIQIVDMNIIEKVEFSI